MIIDIHAHCFPDELAVRALSILSKRAGVAPFIDGTVKELKRSMDDTGVNISVLQPIATKPEQTIGVNRWAFSVQDKKIIRFGTMHPDFPDWKEEIKWLVDSGIKGVKFHPNYQDFSVDDPGLFPIYEALFNSGLIVLFHAGVDLWYPDTNLCRPEQLVKILAAFPGARIIAAHMGGFRCWDEVEKHLIGTDVYLDTAYSFEELGAKGMEKLIKLHGTDKILFATDSHWTNPEIEISHIKSLNLNNEEVKMILGGNAKRLLDL